MKVEFCKWLLINKKIYICIFRFNGIYKFYDKFTNDLYLWELVISF